MSSFVGCPSAEPGPIESRFSTPESTVYFYWSSLAVKDYKNALSCFSQYRADSYNEHDVFPVPDVDSLRIEKINNLTYPGRRRAVIAYTVSFYSKNGKKRVFPSGDHLILTPSGWKIDEVNTEK